jgi:hypothetical protein
MRRRRGRCIGRPPRWRRLRATCRGRGRRRWRKSRHGWRRRWPCWRERSERQLGWNGGQRRDVDRRGRRRPQRVGVLGRARSKRRPRDGRQRRERRWRRRRQRLLRGRWGQRRRRPHVYFGSRRRRIVIRNGGCDQRFDDGGSSAGQRVGRHFVVVPPAHASWALAISSSDFPSASTPSTAATPAAPIIKTDART